MSIGKRIAKARTEKEMTQGQLAERLGISSQAVSSWERDEFLPETKNLIALAETLDVTVDALLREDCGWKLKSMNFDKDHMHTFVKTKARDYHLYQTLKMLDVMRRAHAGQKRKSKHGFETEYRVHPLTMACHALAAMKIKDDDVVAAALAHDIVEDNPAIRLEDLPVNDRVREAVRRVW